MIDYHDADEYIDEPLYPHIKPVGDVLEHPSSIYCVCHPELREVQPHEYGLPKVHPAAGVRSVDGKWEIGAPGVWVYLHNALDLRDQPGIVCPWVRVAVKSKYAQSESFKKSGTSS